MNNADIKLLEKYTEKQITNAIFYLEIGGETARRREKILSGLNQVQYAVQNEDDPERLNRIINRGLDILTELMTQHENNTLNPIKNEIMHVLDDLEQHPIYIPSQFDKLNRMLGGGFYPSDLIIIAGKPGMGKTSMMLSLANHVSQTKKTLFFSAEMSKDQLIHRLIASRSQVNLRRLRARELNKNDWSGVTTSAGDIAELKLWIDDRSAPTIQRMQDTAGEIKPEIIFVDYLQILNGQSQKLFEGVTKLSGGLKALAKEFNCPVICGSQLSRKSDDRRDKRPILSDLRQSGAIEQDADIVAFLHRENETDPTELIIRKHRNGPTGTVLFDFKNVYTDFEEKE